jgi:hypothetical protein
VVPPPHTHTRRGREGPQERGMAPPTIAGSADPNMVANPAQLSSTVSMHVTMHSTTSTPLIKVSSWSVWINGYERMSPRSMTWHQSSPYSTCTYKYPLDPHSQNTPQ